MRYYIHQLPISNNNIFRDYDEVRFEFNDYVPVWTGEVETIEVLDNPEKVLEEIFEEFNMRHPENYAGHSLSTSDVVEFVDLDMRKRVSMYYCDSFGWKKVEAK